MRLLITAAILLVFSFPAYAGHRHHRDHGVHGSHHRVATHAWKSARRHTNHRHRYSNRRHRHHHYAERITRGGSGGMVRINTAAGPITVASHLAGRFKALIADFVAHGYRPRHVGCLAHGGHVPNSRHYAGAACDFDQRGWGQTASFMYHARAIIAKHGFRDGCSFNDCGHVDDGKPLRFAGRRRGHRVEHADREDSLFGGS